MNTTTYNELYETFLLNCGYDFDELPQTDEMRYMMIRNACRIYNQQAKKYTIGMFKQKYTAIIEDEIDTFSLY